jgi:hypothetical protein
VYNQKVWLKEDNMRRIRDLFKKRAETSTSKIKSIRCLEVRKFYDSTWEVELKSGEICKIVRDDLETEKELRSAVERCGTAEDIKNLDMRMKIYYD